MDSFIPIDGSGQDHMSMHGFNRSKERMLIPVYWMRNDEMAEEKNMEFDNQDESEGNKIVNGKTIPRNEEIELWIQALSPDMEITPVLAVPINYSSVFEIIPPEHKVIYSTIVMHNNNSSRGGGSGILGAISAVVAISENLLEKYETHALMTRFGIAGKIFSEHLAFIPWYGISKIKGYQIFLSPVRYLDLKRDDAYETNEAFEKRKSEFPVFIIPHIVTSWRAYLNSIKGSKLDPPARKEKIFQLNKMIDQCLDRATKLDLPLPVLEYWDDE